MRFGFNALFTLVAGVVLPLPLRAQQVIQTYPAEQPNGAFGLALDWISDLDGDGWGEVLVGEPRYDNLFSDAGKVYVFSGLTAKEIYSYEGIWGSFSLGLEVAGLGDVSGDGVADFAGQGDDTFVWNGSDGTVLFQTGSLSQSIARIGDLNADGLEDFVVGSATSTPEATVFAGGSFSPLYTVNSPPVTWTSLFGEEAAGLGDVDGDGISDFAIGAPASTVNWPGFVTVFSGVDGALLYTVTRWCGADQFGFALAGVGDVSGDGLGDLLVGAPTALPPEFCGSDLADGFATPGLVSVVDGSTGMILWEFSPPSGGTNQAAGYSVSGAGDVDGNGIPDVLLFYADGDGVFGIARLSDGANGRLIYEIENPLGTQTVFAKGLSEAEDVDGDDFPDFLVGAHGWCLGCYGRVYLYAGAPIGASTFGAACLTASGTFPRIGATGSPGIGTTLGVNLSQVDAGLSAILILGISNTTWAGLPLPLDLGSVGMPGCDLLVAVNAMVPAITTPVSPGQGAATFPLAIPNNPALIGLSLYAQWFVANPAGSQTPGATTRGLQLTFLLTFL